MNKKTLSERDICTQYITPAVQQAGWDLRRQVREEVTFTDGRIIVQGRMHTRGRQKRADYILYYKPNLPLAIIEAKDNKKSVGAGMTQQTVNPTTPPRAKSHRPNRKGTAGFMYCIRGRGRAAGSGVGGLGAGGGGCDVMKQPKRREMLSA